MKRRSALKQTALAFTGLTIASCSEGSSVSEVSSNTSTGDTIRWKMATSWPASSVISFGAAAEFCQILEQLTNGGFVITPYESGELSDEFDVLDAVIDGVAECGHTSGQYYLSKEPALAFSSGLPFGLNARQQHAWLTEGGGLEATHNVYAKLSLINFPCGNTGTQMGGWFDQEVNLSKDFQGLKIRIPGLGAEVLSRLGADTVNLPANEVTDALRTQKLNAVEWSGPYDDEKLGLVEASRYYYYPGWWSPAETYDLVVDIEQWNQIPRQFQEAFRTAARLADQSMLARYSDENAKAFQRIQESGVSLKPFSDEILETARSQAFELYAEIAADNATFSQVYDNWLEFLVQIQQWHSLNELSFVDFVYSSI